MQTEQYLDQPKNNTVITIKITVTITLLAILASQIDYKEILNTAKDVDYSYIFLAALFHAIAFFILCARWWWLLKIHIQHSSYREILGSYYLGLFFNNLLPTGIGGDIVRVLRLRMFGLNTSALVSSTLLDRIIGLMSILAMGIIAVFTLPDTKNNINSFIATGLLVLLLITLFSLFISKATPRIISRISDRFNKYKLLNKIFDVIKLVFEYRSFRPQLLMAFCLSLIAQHFIIFSYIMIGLGLDIELSSSIYFSIVPIVFVTTSLPISIGGLGVRETTLVSLLTLFSVDMQTALALSFIYFSVIITLTAPGGLVILSNRRFKKSL